MRRIAKALCAMLFVVAALSAQSQPRVSFSVTEGYTLPNAPKWHYIGGHTTGVDFSLMWRANDTVYRWNPYYFGTRLSYTHLHNNMVGDRYGAEGFLRNYFTDNIFIDVGAGFSLYTKPYSLTHDPLNEFIGSYLNCLISLGLGYEFLLSNNANLSLAAQFVHSSNGYLKKPNQGLNFLQGAVVYSLPNSDKQKVVPKPAPTDRSAWNYFFSFAPGIVQSRHAFATRDYFFTYSAVTGVMRRLPDDRFALGATLDVMFNGSHKEQFPWYHDPYQYHKIPFYMGATVDAEAFWGDVSLRLGLGWTFKRSLKVNIPFYERIGVFYHFGQGRIRHFVGVAMKAYYAHVDYIEWTYGIRLF